MYQHCMVHYQNPWQLPAITGLYKPVHPAKTISASQPPAGRAQRQSDSTAQAAAAGCFTGHLGKICNQLRPADGGWRRRRPARRSHGSSSTGLELLLLFLLDAAAA